MREARKLGGKKEKLRKFNQEPRNAGRRMPKGRIRNGRSESLMFE
jgi:hypothetical protein